MALSSASSIHKILYDVFISFRGEDTRKNFVDHLYHALQQRNIYTYKDDDSIKKGKRISDELMGSIEDSKYFIIVFSKNYASSSWCLNELLKIMDCHRTTEHTVYPVFYDVEPFEVRNQIGAVGEAFARHEKEEASGKWRKALKEAADLAGWELKNTADGHEAKFIQQIVEKLSLDLRAINVCADKNLIGMDTRISDIVSSLRIASDDVHMIGIWGMGGGGKTTLARAVFNNLSFEFKGKSFIENVREVSKASLSGLNSLQSKIPFNGGKILLVLDDVDHIDQLEALAGDPSWFEPGSIIIITTRDEQVLVAHRVKLIYNVNLLSKGEAICLFSRYAFGREIPIQGYEELSRQVVRYAAGLPLTLKVLGSSLCGKSKPEWVDALARLEKIPEAETQKKLELSYIGLENEQKEMFLDVATIIKGWPKDSTIKALESRGFYAVIGLRVLEQKSLITLDDGGFVDMHDHLVEMGRNIVRRSNPDMPNKHNRLWDCKEIEDILVNDQGTEATRCIKFKYEGQNPDIIMKGLRKMKELHFLYVSMKSNHVNRELDKFIPNFRNALAVLWYNMKNNEASPYFPDALRYLRWDGYPFRYLPKTFQASNLVGIQMESSDMVQLWGGGERKVLNNLRFLELSGSKLRFLDVGLTPNLETLKIKGEDGGDGSVEVYMPVECPKLRSLILYHVKLRSLDIRLTPNLEELDLFHCNDLQELHMGDGFVKLKYLQLFDTKLRSLDLRLSPNLEMLILDSCNNLEEFHIAECPLLTDISISNLQLKTIDLRLSPNLSGLSLFGCELVELHLPTKCLNLMFVNITKSHLRTLVLGLTPVLKELKLESCYDLEELHLADNCQELEDLTIIHSNLREVGLGLTPNLKSLDIRNCCYLEEVHMASECQKLRSLKIVFSKVSTLDLGLTPNIRELQLKECSYLVEVHAPVGCFKSLAYLELRGCLGFRYFLFYLKCDTSGIVNESLEDCPLADLFFTPERCPFHPDNHLLEFKFTCFRKEDLTSLRRSIEKLISEGPCACTKLEMFSRIISKLQC